MLNMYNWTIAELKKEKEKRQIKEAIILANNKFRKQYGFFWRLRVSRKRKNDENIKFYCEILDEAKRWKKEKTYLINKIRDLDIKLLKAKCYTQILMENETENLNNQGGKKICT